MKQLRLYADTSVYGGCFDKEFAEHSLKLVDEIRRGRFLLLVSDTVLLELDVAPPHVQSLLAELREIPHEQIEPRQEILALRNAYVAAGVVGPASLLDAEHIANATVAGADLIVSWNFRHIVHFDKIRAYNAVNLMHGYAQVDIRTPEEVVE